MAGFFDIEYVRAFNADGTIAVTTRRNVIIGVDQRVYVKSADLALESGFECGDGTGIVHHPSQPTFAAALATARDKNGFAWVAEEALPDGKMIDHQGKVIDAVGADDLERQRETIVANTAEPLEVRSPSRGERCE